jgi:hypothetical protein
MTAEQRFQLKQQQKAQKRVHKRTRGKKKEHEAYQQLPSTPSRRRKTFGTPAQVNTTPARPVPGSPAWKDLLKPDELQQWRTKNQQQKEEETDTATVKLSAAQEAPLQQKEEAEEAVSYTPPPTYEAATAPATPAVVVEKQEQEQEQEQEQVQEQELVEVERSEVAVVVTEAVDATAAPCTPSKATPVRVCASVCVPAQLTSPVPIDEPMPVPSFTAASVNDFWADLDLGEEIDTIVIRSEHTSRQNSVEDHEDDFTTDFSTAFHTSGVQDVVADTTSHPVFPLESEQKASLDIAAALSAAHQPPCSAKKKRRFRPKKMYKKIKAKVAEFACFSPSKKRRKLLQSDSARLDASF